MLSDKHLELIRSSAISDPARDARGYDTITDEADLARLGFVPDQRRVPGLLIPLRGIDGQVWGHQFRPDTPRSRDDRVVKYETPVGQRNAFDVPVGVPVGDPDSELWITEGSRKADAAWSAGIACVSVQGVWNWRTRDDAGRSHIIDDIVLGQWEGREVILAFDSDALHKRQVGKALAELGEELKRRGARPQAIILGSGRDKVGLDDFLNSGGDLVKCDRRPTGWLDHDRRFAVSPWPCANQLQQMSWTDKPTKLSTLMAWRGTWWQWTGQHWREIEIAELRAELYGFLGAAFTPDGKPWPANKQTIANVVEALNAVSWTASELTPPTWTDDHETGPLVACHNGLLDVESRELLPHTPAYLNLNSVPFDWDPETPEPKLWLAFLEELFGTGSEQIVLLQQWFGYVISGETRHQKIALLIGPLRAGKGTIVRILGALAGEANLTSPTAAALGQQFGLASLIGKSVAVVADARFGSSDNSAAVERLLSISGEDVQTIQRKYKDDWSGMLPTRLMVLSNETPRLADVSGALPNRFVTLRFSKTFIGHEDTNLTNKLKSELPGILRWAVDGYARLAAEGRFRATEDSKEALLDMLTQGSPVFGFTHELCDVDPLLDVEVDTLYAAYVAWCNRNGRRPVNKARFGTDLRAVHPGVEKERTRVGADRIQRYIGIGLKSDGPVSDSSPYGQAGHSGHGDYPLFERGRESVDQKETSSYVEQQRPSAMTTMDSGSRLCLSCDRPMTDPPGLDCMLIDHLEPSS